MTDTTYRRRLLGTSMFAGAALVAAASLMAAPVMAQDAQEDDAVDDIVVTGSRIARQDYVANSPIVTVTHSPGCSRIGFVRSAMPCIFDPLVT